MEIKKLEKVMRNFEESYLFELLGDLRDSLLEWSVDSNMMLKKNIVNIIISDQGLKLLENEKFRYKYYLSMEDITTLKLLCDKVGIEFSEPFNHEDIALKLSKIKFGEKEPYIYLIKEYFGCADYVFKKHVSESPLDICEKNDEKFFELYDYQYMIKQQVINDLSNPDKELYKILVHMPTGTGKTKTTMHIIAQYLNFISKGKGLVVWIAHSNELLTQAYNTFKNVWRHLSTFDFKIYKGWVDMPDTFDDGMLFVSIQELLVKMGSPVYKFIDEHASLIIFDEVHKAGASKYKECIDGLMNKANQYGKRFIGLTATPGRTTEISRDNYMFSQEFDHIVGIDVNRINMITLSENEARNYQGSKDPIKYFQERRFLAKIERRALQYNGLNPILLKKLEKELENTSDDYSPTLVAKVGLNKARNIKIIEELLELNKKNIPTIVFACSLQHAKMLSAFLNIQNIPNSLVHGNMDYFSRKEAIRAFKDKTNPVNIIINFDILTTGFDSTNIKCVFITRPTKSVVLYSQMIGRGLRGPNMGGNEHCLLIDVEENLKAYNENDAFKHFDIYWK